MALLTVENLQVAFRLAEGEVTALHGIDFSVACGERIGIVGESGAGKSLLGLAILRLIAPPGRISVGRVIFDKQDLMTISDKALRNIRGQRISMIFQDPLVTLNPVLRIETQMLECLKAHRNISNREARNIALEKLSLAQIPSPEKRLKQFPHELSGGMQQRVVIAIALLLEPQLLIADEPTTALDVTIQAQIMQLLQELCEQQQMALILITHDLGVVAQMTHRTIVMYCGRAIEMRDTTDLIQNPQHPYTQGLIKALPQSAKGKKRLLPIEGQMPSIEAIPPGCPFHPRCKQALAKCSLDIPPSVQANSRSVSCFLYNE